MPPTTHCFRYTGFNQSGEESLPAWVQSLPPRPTIYASLGTVFNQVPGLMSAILEALRHEPVNLIISVGRNGDPSTFGEQPPHVHIERYIPQELLLPHCDLVITQAGSGTMMDTLSHGLPMVMLPIAADQPENAQRCAEIGVAAVLGREARTPTDIRDAAREVLNNPSYRRNAQQVQQEIQALPGLDHAAGLLERLAVERAPILS
jgi:MGT family glycosyltransferase